MAITYENRRGQFDKILKKYMDYLAIYKEINHGSLQGASTFEEFYWRETYYSRYPNHAQG